jgi:hypothetical protein
LHGCGGSDYVFCRDVIAAADVRLSACLIRAAVGGYFGVERSR